MTNLTNVDEAIVRAVVYALSSGHPGQREMERERDLVRDRKAVEASVYAMSSGHPGQREMERERDLVRDRKAVEASAYARRKEAEGHPLGRTISRRLKKSARLANMSLKAYARACVRACASTGGNNVAAKGWLERKGCQSEK
jgi:hypothetical protein